MPGQKTVHRKPDTGNRPASPLPISRSLDQGRARNHGRKPQGLHPVDRRPTRTEETEVVDQTPPNVMPRRNTITVVPVPRTPVMMTFEKT